MHLIFNFSPKQIKNILGFAFFVYLYVLLRISDKDELLEYYSLNEDMQIFLHSPRMSSLKSKHSS